MEWNVGKSVMLNHHFDLKFYQPRLVTEATIVRRGVRVEVTLPLTGLYIVMEGSLIQIEVLSIFYSVLGT